MRFNIIRHLLGILHLHLRQVGNAIFIENRRGRFGLGLWLHILTGEIVHIDLIPVVGHLMSILRIKADFFDGTSCQIVIRSYVGMGRTDVVLYADGSDDSYLIANLCCQILGIEVAQESVHLLIGHS